MTYFRTLMVMVLISASLFLFGETLAEAEKVKWVKSKHGLRQLMRLSKTRGDMVDEYYNETEAHRRLSRDIDRNELKTGLYRDRLIDRYDDPVIVFGMDDGGEKWVYKPGKYTFLQQPPKIYLNISADGHLESWEVIAGDPPAEKSDKNE